MYNVPTHFFPTRRSSDLVASRAVGVLRPRRPPGCPGLRRLGRWRVAVRCAPPLVSLVHGTRRSRCGRLTKLTISYTLPRRGASAIIGPTVRSKGTAQRPPAGRLPVQREDRLPEHEGTVVGRRRDA